MARAEYVVALVEGEWTVSLNGAPHGPYSSQETAARAAIEAAHKAEAMGHEASVEVRDAGAGAVAAMETEPEAPDSADEAA